MSKVNAAIYVEIPISPNNKAAVPLSAAKIIYQQLGEVLAGIEAAATPLKAEVAPTPDHESEKLAGDASLKSA